LNAPATIRAEDPKSEPVTLLSLDLNDPNQIGLPVRKPVNIKHRAGGVIQVTKEKAVRSLRRVNTTRFPACTQGRANVSRPFGGVEVHWTSTTAPPHPRYGRVLG
jgi:hypothetical protein